MRERRCERFSDREVKGPRTVHRFIERFRDMRHSGAWGRKIRERRRNDTTAQSFSRIDETDSTLLLHLDSVGPNLHGLVR